MTRYVAGACIDENGRASGGRAGDNNGREVCVHTLASSGSWTSILRPPRNADAIVKQAYAAAENDRIGYDQSQRTTLYTAAKAKKYDLSKITTACECDCSSLVAVLAIGAGFAVSKDMYTGNEVAALMACGFVKKAYSESALKAGDILWRNGHTVVYVGTSKTYKAPTKAATTATAKKTTTAGSKTVAKAKPVEVAKLVDLSHWNTVNLAAVKAAGWHVILKAGEGTSMTDNTFASRAKQCEQLGIPYGVYYYARAANVTQAENEAARCLKLIKGRRLSYPVYYDIEEEGIGKTAEACTRAFCNAIERAGYWAGVYTYISYWNAHLRGLGDRYTKWIASYGTNDGKPHTAPAVNRLDIWQYSSKGSVPGVSGTCDVNIVYRDLVSEVTGKPVPPAKDILYRVKLVGGAWSVEKSGNRVAGTAGRSIGYIAISGVKKYRVKTAKGWLPWVSRYDITDTANGCAGDGSAIYALEVADDTCRYAVNTMPGGWLPDMVGQRDTGGSKDTFAGNGRKIEFIRMRRA